MIRLNKIKLIITVLFVFLLTGCLPALAGDTTPVNDSVNSLINRDTLLNSKDKVKLFFNLSETFNNAPEKAVVYDYLGIELAQKNGWYDDLVLASMNYARHSDALCKYEQADSVLTAVEEFVDKIKSVKKSEYYFQRASVYYDWSKYQLAKEYYEKALEEFKKHKDKIGIAKSLKGLGATVSIWSDYESAIGYLQQARDIYNELGDKEGIKGINLSMGVVLEQWNKIDVALNYYKNALEYYESTNNIFGQANLKLHIGDLYLKKGNYLKALDYYFSAQRLERKQPHKKLRSITLSNIGEAYYYMGKYKDALDYQNQALKIKYEVGDRKRIAISLNDLGRINLALKNFNKAINYAREAYHISDASGLNVEAIESLHLLAEGFHYIHQLDSAYYYLNKYVSLKDQIFNQQNAKTFNNLEIKYGTREKEKENQVLKLKNAQNELKLKEERNNKYMVIIVTTFIFLIALVVIVFIRIREKQNRKNNFLLKLKNKEITAQKEKLTKLNRELNESRSKYMSIVENATVGMFRTTRDGKVLFANKFLMKMIEMTWDDLQKINLNKDKPERQKLLDLVNKHKIVTGREDVWYKPDGSRIFVNESIWIVNDESGKPAYYEGIVEDITKRKLAELELKEKEKKLRAINNELSRNNVKLLKARMELEKAYNTKSEFLANISHEIRTPLNAIIGFTDLLNGMVKDSSQRQFVQAIRSSGRSLLSLINDILDLSKIQAGKIELHFEPVSLETIVSDISKIFALSVKEKELEFIVETHPSLSKLIFLDDTRMRQILFNLLGNAVKFTDKGFVKLKVEVKSETSTEMDLEIVVSDSGMGIPPDKQEDVFEAFVQNNGGKHPGTGLGLSITKRLIEIMNGTITMVSEQQKGTEFVINLPGIKIFEGNVKDKERNTSDADDYSLDTDDSHAVHCMEIGKTEMNRITKSEFKLRFGERCSVLQNSRVIKDFSTCADDLIAFAAENKFKKLKKLGEELKEATRNFDIEKIKSILGVFKTLLN